MTSWRTALGPDVAPGAKNSDATAATLASGTKLSPPKPSSTYSPTMMQFRLQGSSLRVEAFMSFSVALFAQWVWSMKVVNVTATSYFKPF